MARRDPSSRIWIFILILLVIYTFEALIAMRRAVVSETITQRLLMDLQERMFDHLQRLPHSFYSYANVGDVMARLSGDIQMVSMTMTEVLNQGLYLVVSFITPGSRSSRSTHARRARPRRRADLRPRVQGARRPARARELRPRQPGGDARTSRRRTCRRTPS